MSDNRYTYLIKKPKHEEKDNFISEEELDELILSSALLTGLSFTQKNNEHRIKPIGGWKCPKAFQQLSQDQVEKIRNLYKITVDGENVAVPISDFKSMKFPMPILTCLLKNKIISPTPIQMQGIPIILSGRDTISISFTGTGKSLVFILPMLMLALDIEVKSPIKPMEGPFIIVIVPSRELAIQLHETVNDFIKYFMKSKDKIYPIIKNVLCIGGDEIKYQSEDLALGCHIVIGTPGRLTDLAEKKKLKTNHCQLLILDEADRLVDIGFDEDVKKILEKFTTPRQTCIFSSTMPKKIQEFTKKKLWKPVVVNLGRSGSANTKIIQEIEFIKDESKIINLLPTLQKTPPPVLIFCENKSDVDEIHEYLLLKGIDACSIHGDKDQFSRIKAIREFRNGLKDVLISTDILSKGIHFPNVEHVINYDMPKEIENYVLRIGRTGRLGKFGLATTFISRNQDEAILLDLKHLLIESKQPVPGFINSIPENEVNATLIECPFCGGLGHKLNQCHKLENQRIKMLQSKTSLHLIENLKYVEK